MPRTRNRAELARSKWTGNSGQVEVMTSCREAESYENEGATELELLSEDGENAPRKALFFPHFHQVVNILLSDRKSNGEECNERDNPVTRPVTGVLKLCRLAVDNASSLKQKSISNMDEDKDDTPEDNAAEREVVSEVVCTDGNDHVESDGGPSLRCPSKKAPVHRVRNDLRNKYLTNLGIVPNQGGPPAILRRPSFDETAVVEEKLKDEKDSDVILDDLVRIIKSLVGPGGSKDKDDSQARPDLCDVCRDELRVIRRNFSSTQDQEAVSSCDYTCTHKRVKFSNTVTTVYVPTHQEYSNRVRRSYWAGVGEIREMVYRNMIEFDAEGYQWENVAEETDMYYCEGRREYIHPVFCDADNTAHEVVDDGVGSAVFLNEGKSLPTLKQNEGIWA